MQIPGFRLAFRSVYIDKQFRIDRGRRRRRHRFCVQIVNHINLLLAHTSITDCAYAWPSQSLCAVIKHSDSQS